MIEHSIDLPLLELSCGVTWARLAGQKVVHEGYI